MESWKRVFVLLSRENMEIANSEVDGFAFF